MTPHRSPRSSSTTPGVQDRPTSAAETRRTPGRHLLIDPALGQLPAVRRFVTDELGLVATSDQLFLVAVTEVVTNAIGAHRRIDSADPVSITVDVDARVVHVADRGDGFDGTAIEREIDAVPPGYGLAIVAAVSPRCTWRPNDPAGIVVSIPYPEGLAAS